MGSAVKALNPITATKKIVSAVTGGGSGGTTYVESPAETGAAATEDSVAKANQAQYMAKTRGDNQADISGTLAVGADAQASAPTMLSGLGGVPTDDKKLSKRKALGS